MPERRRANLTSRALNLLASIVTTNKDNFNLSNASNENIDLSTKNTRHQLAIELMWHANSTGKKQANPGELATYSQPIETNWPATPKIV